MDGCVSQSTEVCRRAEDEPARRDDFWPISVRRHGENLFVPRISEFYGIVIAMYYREHGVPHFHATYAGETIVVAIETGDVLAGSVPARALRLVQEWAELHREELRRNWGRAREDAPLDRIDPLP